MKHDVPIKNGIVIPSHELEITASRAGGPGGQHVNKTSTRITVRWNIKKSDIMTAEQKERIIQKLASAITAEGDLIIHSSSSRSQDQNKKDALDRLAYIVRNALHIPKKRMATKVSRGTKEARLQEKGKRSKIKKMRGRIDYD
jgi:ribosome-associated protein